MINLWIWNRKWSLDLHTRVSLLVQKWIRPSVLQAQVSGTNTQLLICQHIGQVQGNVGSHQGKMRCSVKKLQNNPEISTFPKSVRHFSRCEANTQQMFKTWAGAAEESTELSSKTLFFVSQLISFFTLGHCSLCLVCRGSSIIIIIIFNDLFFLYTLLNMYLPWSLSNCVHTYEVLWMHLEDFYKRQLHCNHQNCCGV